MTMPAFFKLIPCIQLTWRIALALLTISVTNTATAQQQSSGRTAELQAKVERVVKHLNLRRDAMVITHAERQTLVRQLGEALDAWNASQRTDAQAVQMEAWLDQVIRSSMLGAGHPWPDAPPFDAWLPMPEAEDRELPTPKPDAIPTPAAPPATPAASAAPHSSLSQPERLLSPSAPGESLPPVPDTPIEQASKATIALAPPAHPPSATETRNETETRAAWSDHPAATEIDWGDPFANEEPLARSAPSTRQREQRLKPVSQSRAVKIDLLELSSRAAGHNAKLRELEGVLLGSRDLTAFRLAAIVRDLDELRDHQAFLGLYIAGLTREEKLLGPRLDSPLPLLRSLDRAIDVRSENLRGDNSNQADAERAILSALRKKMAELQIDFQTNV